MPSTRLDNITDQLRKLQSASPEIEAAAVVSNDGLLIASILPPDVEGDRVSAMSASLLSLSERISLELGRGLLDQVFIRGVNGDVLIIAIGEEAVLTVMARRDAKLGMMLYYMKRAAKELTGIL